MKLYEIGNNIKIKRKEACLTQQELAINSGISRVTLGKLERGEVTSISIKTLDLILSEIGYEIEFINKKGFGLPTLDELQS
ncbi:MAG: helix-turn-helix transcriptional regulator [Spirochaetales bacterium]|nr:helix-turn-helix transcriptional regulator [Spirochaetales bacterium]